MSTMSGGQAAVASLKAENVDHVFGLIGSALGVAEVQEIGAMLLRRLRLR